MPAAIRCRHLHRQRGLPRLQGGSGAGRDSACCAGRLRPPPPWDRSDSAAAVLRGRRPRARWARSAAFPSGSAKARIWRILGFNFTMSWHQLKACTAHIAGFVHGIRILAICSCGGISQICQWYRVCDAGALRAEPLATLLSCAVKNRSQIGVTSHGLLQRQGGPTAHTPRVHALHWTSEGQGAREKGWIKQWEGTRGDARAETLYTSTRSAPPKTSFHDVPRCGMWMLLSLSFLSAL